MKQIKEVLGLKELYEFRTEFLLRLDEQYKEYVKTNKIVTEEKHDELLKIISHVVENKEIEEQISDCIEDLITEFYKEAGYFQEKSYKQGFIDGVNIMTECLYNTAPRLTSS